MADYKDVLMHLKYKMEEAHKKYEEFKKQCPHNIIRSGDVAVCSICEKRFGWWCPESSDSVCHYTGEFNPENKT